MSAEQQVTSTGSQGAPDPAAAREAAARRPIAGRRGRATRPSHPHRPCLNCGDSGYGEYCPSCGQRKVDVQVSVRALVADVVEDQLLVDRRLPRTLHTLLFRPGRLTVEFVNGRIASYARPFKLYLASSVIFFLVLSFVSLRALDRAEFGDFDGGAAVPAELSDEASDQAGPDEVSPQTARAGEEPGRDTVPAPRPTGEPSGLSDWLRSAQVNTGYGIVDAALTQRLRRLGQLEPRQAVQEVVRTFLSYVPTTMFVLLPVFAGILKLLYIRRRRFYAEHFVFLLHTHAFLFIVFTLILLVRPWLTSLLVTALFGWMFVYVYLAMKQVYGQGWFKTFVKYWTLGWMYFWVLVVSIPFLLIATLLLLPR